MTSPIFEWFANFCRCRNWWCCFVMIGWIPAVTQSGIRASYQYPRSKTATPGTHKRHSRYMKGYWTLSWLGASRPGFRFWTPVWVWNDMYICSWKAGGLTATIRVDIIAILFKSRQALPDESLTSVKLNGVNHGCGKTTTKPWLR